jgi:protein gp37
VIGGVQVSGSRVFVVTDVFGEWVPDELLDLLFSVFASRQDVTWQVLTKRAERMRDYTNQKYTFDNVTGGRNGTAARIAELAAKGDGVARLDDVVRLLHAYPFKNVWLGVSAEDQQRWNERVPLLCQTPAAIRFVSAEPLLGEIEPTLCFHSSDDPNQFDHSECATIPDWLIVGGESGPGARPCDIAWVRNIVESCKACGVSVFVKQLGSHVVAPNDEISGWLDRCPTVGVEHGMPIQGELARLHLRDKKGGDMAEFPNDLRVREFPQTAAEATR